MKKSAPQAIAISIVWPKSGSATSSATTMREQDQGEDVAGDIGAAGILGKQPGDDDDEGRLHELRGLQRNAERG